jgi:hypothetical protein
MVRVDDLKDRKPPLVAKPLGKEYTERLNQQVWLPLLAGLDPKSASALTLLFVGVFAALHVMKTLVPSAAPKNDTAGVGRSESP